MSENITGSVATLAEMSQGEVDSRFVVLAGRLATIDGAQAEAEQRNKVSAGSVMHGGGYPLHPSNLAGNDGMDGERDQNTPTHEVHRNAFDAIVSRIETEAAPANHTGRKMWGGNDANALGPRP